jgi:hypothetical protein
MNYELYILQEQNLNLSSSVPSILGLPFQTKVWRAGSGGAHLCNPSTLEVEAGG